MSNISIDDCIQYFRYDIVVLTKDGYLTATQLGIQRRFGFVSDFFRLMKYVQNKNPRVLSLSLIIDKMF